jgi:hypothetical protein
MSDLQEIIVNSSIRAFRSGMQHERDHIIKLLESGRWQSPNEIPSADEKYLPVSQVIALIKEQS